MEDHQVSTIARAIIVEAKLRAVIESEDKKKKHCHIELNG